MNHNGQNSGMGGNDGAARPFSVSIGETPQEGADDVQSGNLTWRTLISGDRTPSDQITLGVADFPPHGTLNVHRHEPAEFYFGLTGEGTVFVNGASFRIAQGIAVSIRRLFLAPCWWHRLSGHDAISRERGLQDAQSDAASFVRTNEFSISSHCRDRLVRLLRSGRRHNCAGLQRPQSFDRRENPARQPAWESRDPHFLGTRSIMPSRVRHPTKRSRQARRRHLLTVI